MANEKHLKILKQGGEVWNRWRKESFGIIPDFRGADLRGTDLINADLRGADLGSAYINNTDLSKANLINANLSAANLINACIINANLINTNLTGANLAGADLSKTDLGGTVLVNLDLSNVQGLEACIHHGPSFVDHRTLTQSGPLPLSFLRGVGLPDTYIDYIPSLFNQPLQFYSCFISYSSKDQEFAERLYADLQNKGVRCWYAPEDLPIGAKIRVGIDEAIRRYDRLLLILSESSVNSQWVEQEVETALEKERDRNNQVVLFPVRLDNAVMDSGDGWTRLIKNTRNIGDFCQWKDHDAYQKTFERLVRDLKASLVAKG
ncbi:MAG: toll/interleukin-1 receptor domain-containing protein [Cyanobacteria bacterium P01_H01_bin.105]